ncbi:MAG TPA: phenylalanine--tRNA ligase beta subunit-related protein [Thermoanaerobaculia bacterium]|jgi:DNA/RNA-binding domain of Phe-tRNA-synthetase-like protein|nr:phenylalanine--tRNA ligase beta subunit-related protein [Thermoanaerobaculia bacterium]
MARFLVAPEIFALFPDAVLGVIVAREIDNTREDETIQAALREEEARVRGLFAAQPIAEHPRIAPWREAYRKFGARPKDHPSSIENLVRRVAKGHAVPKVNPMVDLYNTVSLRFLLPAGGEDLDRTQGDVRLTVAGEGEAPVRLLGEPEARPPYPGEVIYKDDAGVLCRRWNWKEADRTKLTPQTRRAILVLEGLPPVGVEQIVEATGTLAALLSVYCHPRIFTAVIDRGRPEMPLEAS